MSLLCSVLFKGTYSLFSWRPFCVCCRTWTVEVHPSRTPGDSWLIVSVSVTQWLWPVCYPVGPSRLLLPCCIRRCSHPDHWPVCPARSRPASCIGLAGPTCRIKVYPTLSPSTSCFSNFIQVKYEPVAPVSTLGSLPRASVKWYRCVHIGMD